ncbi:MAG: 5'/3'-nucleotidase SurE [Dehalococcoidia bacterium]
MKVLLTSEEGYRSPGVAALRQALIRADLNVITVAPAAPRSNSGPSIPACTPPETIESAGGDLANPIFRVEGTPLECVRVAVGLGLVDHDSIVVAGVRHSATYLDSAQPAPGLEAALEGALLGRPSLAISRESADHGGAVALHNDDYGWCGTLAAELVSWMLASPPPVRSILNVNVPSPLRARHLKLVDGSPSTRADPGVTQYAAQAVHHGELLDDRSLATPSDFANCTESQAVTSGHVSIAPLQLGTDGPGDGSRLHAWARQMVAALDIRLGGADRRCVAGCCG